MMGRLKRYTSEHATKPLWAIEYRGSEEPPILPGEEGIVEIVAADAMAKPQAQLDAEADAFKLALRALFEQAVDGSTPEGFMSRTIALTVLNETNRLRAWITSFKAAVAASTSLANLKTGVAALNNMPEVQPVTMKNELKAKGNSGLAD